MVRRAADGVLAAADRGRFLTGQASEVEVGFVVFGRTEVLAARQLLQNVTMHTMNHNNRAHNNNNADSRDRGE